MHEETERKQEEGTGGPGGNFNLLLLLLGIALVGGVVAYKVILKK